MGCICLVDECRVEWLWSSEKKVMLNLVYRADTLRPPWGQARFSLGSDRSFRACFLNNGWKSSLPWGTIIWNLGQQMIPHLVAFGIESIYAYKYQWDSGAKEPRTKSSCAPLLQLKEELGCLLRCNINYPTFPSGIPETAVSPVSSSPRIEPIRPKCVCLSLSLKS